MLASIARIKEIPLLEGEVAQRSVKFRPLVVQEISGGDVIGFLDEVFEANDHLGVASSPSRHGHG